MRPTLVALEDRRLLSTFVVNNPTDTPVAGETDLRQAITSANATTGANTITFDSTFFATPQTITLDGTQLELSNTTGTLTITGPAAGVTVSGNNASRVFQVDANVTASISGLTISGGNTTGFGAGLYIDGGTITLTNCTVSGNHGSNWGGGLFNNGTATLTNCTVVGNSGVSGGGLYDQGGMTKLTNCTVSDNSATLRGGGVSDTGGITTILNCTVSGNSAVSAGGGLNNNFGATTTMANCTVSSNTSAHYGGGLSDVAGTINLTNCTVSGNSASTSGGGVYNLSVMSLSNCTVSGNSAAGNGGGLDDARGTVTIGNTIAAGNTGTSSGPDAYGTFTSQGNNLIGKTDGSSGWAGSDLTGTIALPLNPLLAPLAYYGGPTETMPLLPGSPAIGAGNIALIPSGITTDQRGYARIESNTVDIGAYEVQAIPLVVSTTADGIGCPLGTLDLREAIDLANILPGANTITFDPTVFAGAQTITLLIGTQLELSNTSGTQTITGPAAGVTVSGGGLSRVFQVGSGVTASISGLSITAGGGEWGGGGLLVSSGGTATLTDCTVSGNHANYGGGLLSYGTTMLSDVTVSGNTANGAAGVWVDGGTTTLTDCTLSGNSTAGNGGGLNAEAGTTTLTDCTVSGNSGLGGGLYSNSPVPTTIANTIVAGNTASGSGPDAFGSFASGGHNLIGETDGSSGWVGSDLTGTIASPLDALLAPLGNYGGPTQTMALLPGSPAIGNGIVTDYPGTSTPISTDERGIPRGSLVDIGAVQASLVVESTTGSVDTSTAGLTLPGAVLLANQFPYSVISFDPVVFAGPKTITLTAQLEFLDTAIAGSITGPAAGLTISGGGITRVFQVDSGVAATLSGLTISGGSTTGYGGGLYNDGGTVTLTDVTLSSNIAGKGGGVFNTGRGTIGITSCSITGNSATNGGGLYNDYGTATLTGVTVSSNIAGQGRRPVQHRARHDRDYNLLDHRQLRHGSGGGLYNLGARPHSTAVP